MSDEKGLFAVLEDHPGEFEDLVSGAHGITQALYEHFPELPLNAQLLLISLRSMTTAMYNQIGTQPVEFENRLDKATKEYLAEQSAP